MAPMTPMNPKCQKQNSSRLSFLMTIVLVTAAFTAAGFTGCKTVVETADREAVGKDSLLERFFEESDIFSQSITGFALYEPESGSFLHERDSHRYFTPASNTKIFTLYASMKALPEILPSLRYTVSSDTLYFRGTGDPAFLNPYFDRRLVYEFLKNRDEVLVYSDAHYDDRHFGAGWSWDWHAASYAPEKSPFPIYGNMVRFQAQQVALVMLDEEKPVIPSFFETYIDNAGWNSGQSALVDRELRDNRFIYVPKADTAKQERSIPFVYSPELFVDVLADTLDREILYDENRYQRQFDTILYDTPADTLFRQLMLMSDNLVGEQLLLMISDYHFGRMDTDTAIGFAVNEYMQDLPDTPRWADGSGLTRYNLMTPRTIVAMLDKLEDEFGESRILRMFPAGGKSGTLRSFYEPPESEPPFVFAKTGTLRNNHILSGFIYTKSGKRLIFSFMNNNVVVPSGTIRSEMEKVLNLIREYY